MTMKSVISFFSVVKENQSLQKRIQIAIDTDTILRIAKEYSCEFTGTELQAFLRKGMPGNLTSVVNPGVGNRLHMSPR
jgi:Nif11 domain